MGDLPAAETLYREAISLDAGCAQAWTSLGDLLREAGQPEAAYEALQRAVLLAPVLSYLHEALARLFRGGACRHSLTGAVRSRPTLPRFRS